MHRELPKWSVRHIFDAPKGGWQFAVMSLSLFGIYTDQYLCCTEDQALELADLLNGTEKDHDSRVDPVEWEERRG